MKSQLEKDIEIKESFIDLLNDIYPTVKIGYSTFTPAEILECCDPVAFAIGLVEHEDYLAELEDQVTACRLDTPPLLSGYPQGYGRMWITPRFV